MKVNKIVHKSLHVQHFYLIGHLRDSPDKQLDRATEK